MEVWEAKCASCHGIFGESNEVFTPLVGGTTKDDVKTGRVARLTDEGFPGRTTLMKVPTVSTLWDYINRAMPWNAPKSLTHDEVYAVTAFLLNLGDVVPEDFVLSDRNIAEVQQRMPNRNGMTTDHGLWPGKGMGNGGKPDVKAVACMNNCATEPKRGVVPARLRAQRARQPGRAEPHGGRAARRRHHAAAGRRGAGRRGGRRAGADAGGHRGDRCAEAQLPGLPRHGQQDRRPGLPRRRQEVRRAAPTRRLPGAEDQRRRRGVWGPIPMPPQTLPAADAQAIAQWLADGAKPWLGCPMAVHTPPWLPEGTDRSFRPMHKRTP
jgi:S-disulfanyl-L-cysteine oxidoreductase SoxD